jgi:hypothetical protein
MHRLPTFTGLLGLILASSAFLTAQSPIPLPPVPAHKFENHVAHREVRQQHRIALGVQNGTLTPRETAHLERQEARIHRRIHRAEADGHITPVEARRIHRVQNTESRRIFRKKHNLRNRQ